VPVHIANVACQALYDSGADVSCIHDSVFRSFSPDLRPQAVPSPHLQFHSASGDALQVRGVYSISISLLGKTVQHNFCVIKNLSEQVILGADFINQHALAYCPLTTTTHWATPSTWESGVARVSALHTVNPFSSSLLPVSLFTASLARPASHTPLLINVISAEFPALSGGPALIQSDQFGKAVVEVFNHGAEPIVLARSTPVAVIENATGFVIDTIDPVVVNSIAEKHCLSIQHPLLTPEVRKFLTQNADLSKVPLTFRPRYLDLLCKHHLAFSLSSADLGRSDLVMHEINVKTEEPIYVKQFKVPDAHRHYLEDQIKEWLKFGIVQPSRSRYNSPLFLVKKKDGTFRVVQDFRALNANCYVDKYTMKDVTECINEIGRANSTIFSTLDLTSGFWQMLLHPKSRKFTAFTLPGLGQFEWITSSMGLLGCPSSFQRLVEAVVHGIADVIVYIDDIIIHSSAHDVHLKQLDQLFTRLIAHNLKVKLQKCVFGSNHVQYLGFLLSEDGIRPGTDKLKAVQMAAPPISVKEVRQFLGLCNFFRTHVRNFAQISAPLTALTRKDSGFTAKIPLPAPALAAFRELQSILCSEPVISFPRRDRQYALITDAALGDSTHAGGLGAVLTQTTASGAHHVIAYASRKLQKHECNYTPFLLEMQAAIWGMEHFETYLRGKHFILYTDHKPLEKLGKVHTRTFYRLQELMNEFEFEICYKKGDEMPADFLSRNAVDSINLDMSSLAKLQDDDPTLRCLKLFLLQKQLPDEPHLRNLVYQLSLDSFIEDGVLWTRLKTSAEKRVVIMAPQAIISDILAEAHGHVLAGHDGLLKTKERILLSYYWPGMDKDITSHIQQCHECQVRKPSRSPPPLLSPLPQCTAPNQRIHCDCFGPLRDSSSKKMILCMTDAFTKYVELVVLPDKEAVTVTSAIFNRWICRFGLPLEIVTDRGREFSNKVSEELYSLLRLHHQQTAARHPQCNSQAEVCNKTIAKYLNSFVDKSTLDWEQYIAPLMFSYNTSFHRSVKNTPFFLTFGIEPRLPSFPNPDLRERFYGESSAAEMFQRLQVARQTAVQSNLESTGKSSDYFNKSAKPHSFAINQMVLLEEYNFLGKNQKLSPKFSGPHIILSLKGTHNAEILMNNKRKVIVNVQRLKPYYSPPSPVSPLTSSLSVPPEQPPLPVMSSHSSDSEGPSELSLPLTLEPPAPLLGAPCRRGRPKGSRPPPPPSLSQNDGGICTRSKTLQKEIELKANTHISPGENVTSLRNDAIGFLKDAICFREKCFQNTHSRSCIAKAKNLMREGDIYKNQKAFFELDLESDSEEENESEINEEENDVGLGGSSPIPSVHHSFDENETLTHEVEDEFSQEEEEEVDRTEDENFLSVLSELSELNETIDISEKEELSKSQKFKQAGQALQETKRLKKKCEDLLPKISPNLRKEVYKKIDWSTFRIPPPSPGGLAGPSTSTPTRQTRSAGPAVDPVLPDRPLEYKKYSKK